MKVLYTCDNNYVWMMSISMISLFETHKNVENLEVYFIGENISVINKEKIENIAKTYKRKCIILELPKIDLPNEIVSKRWPKSAFSRLFAAEILPNDIEKILYLDCDTIVKENLSQLFDKNYDSYIFYGVKDCIGKEYKKNIGLEENSVYVNAGVLLINLDELRKINVYNRIEEFLNKYKKMINYADQDILNGTFKGKIGCLNANYNVMTIEFVYSHKEIIKLRRPSNYYNEEEIINAVEIPAIIHYTTNMIVVRPWFQNSNHPRRGDFLNIFEKNNSFNIEFKKFEVRNKKDKILSLLLKLPKKISLTILGIIHSELLPRYKRMRG